MKKTLLISLALSLILLLALPMSALAANNIKVFIDGRQITFDTQPTVEDGTTLVPMRAIFEGLGATVSWDAPTKTVVGTKDYTVVRLTLGDYYGMVNDESVFFNVAAKSVNGRILVPLRFVSESFGCNVNWNNATRIITITSGQAKKPLVTVDQLPMSISIEPPDSIGTIWMKAAYTNNSQYPIKGFTATVLLKEINETTHFCCYDTVMPGETSPLFETFGPPSQNIGDTEIIEYTITVVDKNYTEQYIKCDPKLGKYEWF